MRATPLTADSSIHQARSDPTACGKDINQDRLAVPAHTTLAVTALFEHPQGQHLESPLFATECAFPMPARACPCLFVLHAGDAGVLMQHNGQKNAHLC